MPELPDQEARAMRMKEIRTKGGYLLPEVVSSLQKSIRRADEEAALYWSLEMVESGYGKYLWKRLMIISAEDVGVGDALALVVTTCAWLATKETTKSFTTSPFMRTEFLGVAILHLCRSGKSREGDDAVWWASERRKRGWRLEVSDAALDFHTQRGRAMGRGLQHWFAEAARLENQVQVMGDRYGQLVRELLGTGEEELPVRPAEREEEGQA